MICDSLGQTICRGVILWRPVASGDALDVEFKPQRTGMGWMCRLGFYSTITPILEPVVQCKGENGYVSLLRNLPPPDWTHLVVVALSDKSCFAAAPQPFDMTEYLVWRSAVAGVVREYRGFPVEQLKERLLAVPPPEIRHNEIRALITGEGRSFHYVYLGGSEYR